jgi:hypothetical protein
MSLAKAAKSSQSVEVERSTSLRGFRESGKALVEPVTKSIAFSTSVSTSGVAPVVARALAAGHEAAAGRCPLGKARRATMGR